jgi:hypothetical protein
VAAISALANFVVVEMEMVLVLVFVPELGPLRIAAP